MTDKEKIREEVQRLMNELIQEKEKGYGSDTDVACILELQNILTYIDSLREEPVSEDLEEAAKNHAVERFRTTRNRELAEKCKWSYIIGAKWQKQQMIAKAIDATARPDDNEIWCNLASSNLKDGDKVKIIVIKKD